LKNEVIEKERSKVMIKIMINYLLIRCAREAAATPGLSHRSIAVVATGRHTNRCCVVCACDLQSGQRSDTFGFSLFWKEASKEHIPDCS
jgi:hypothetical protein